jgi:hypothetical protein
VETNTFGCNSTSNIATVVAASSPAATITPLGNLNICLTGAVILQANIGIGYSYQWKKGSADLAGATNSTYTATKAATYKVKVTNNGCSKISGASKVTKTCRNGAIISVEQEANVIVYPNPSNGKFTVVFKGSEESTTLPPFGSTIAVIEVRDMMGRTVNYDKLAVNSNEFAKEYSFDPLFPEGCTS